MMQSRTERAPVHVKPETTSTQRTIIASDGGPLLFLLATVSFALVLALVIYISRISF